jgi:hypothetical protein
VHEVAEVTLNGQYLGILWRAPYRVDITDAVRRGPNDLRIQVTNLWPNRIIGDLQPGATKRYTWAPMVPVLKDFTWKVDSKLLPSGLLGPVTVMESTTEQAFRR